MIAVIITFISFTTAHATLNEEDLRKNNPDNFISVEFNNAPLSEIVALVSEVSGNSFVISAEEPIVLSWVEQNLFKDDLINRFKEVITGAGLLLHSLPSDTPLYIIKKTPSVLANSPESIGFYHLKNLNPQSLKDTSEVLYAGSLAVNSIEGSNVVLFTGSPDLVNQFMELLSKIDTPLDTDIATIRVKHISVKAAIKALTDTKLISDNTFFPDYWNRSVLIKGTPYEREVAGTIIKSIDQPQSGWIDQLEYVRTVDSEAITSVLSSTCENVEVRKIASDRILLSGFEKEVEKASVLLHKIDGSGLQVKVEAVIAYLTDNEFQELGLKLNYKNTSLSGKMNNGILSNLVSQNTGLLINYFNDFLSLDIAANKGDAHGEIISSPVLTVLNGQEARIHVGQNVPYLSTANFNKNDGAETSTSIQRKDIGITFKVKPTIEPNGEFIHLIVSQEVSNVTDDSEISQSAVDIVVDKKEIESTVLLADGDTVFLGGLRSEENGTAQDYVPILGEIPILGNLFKYDVEKKENRHLIVSVRVNVIGKS